MCILTPRYVGPHGLLQADRDNRDEAASLVEWKTYLFEWYYWRSSCEVPNHVDRHAVHWEDKAMIMMSLDYHHHHRIVQQGQGEGRVHNFTEDGDVTGDVSD